MKNLLAPILERANITYRMRKLRSLIEEAEQAPPSIERDNYLDTLKYELDVLRHHYVFLIVSNKKK